MCHSGPSHPASLRRGYVSVSMFQTFPHGIRKIILTTPHSSQRCSSRQYSFELPVTLHWEPSIPGLELRLWVARSEASFREGICCGVGTLPSSTPHTPQDTSQVHEQPPLLTLTTSHLSSNGINVRHRAQGPRSLRTFTHRPSQNPKRGKTGPQNRLRVASRIQRCPVRPSCPWGADGVRPDATGTLTFRVQKCESGRVWSPSPSPVTGEASGQSGQPGAGGHTAVSSQPSPTLKPQWRLSEWTDLVSPPTAVSLLVDSSAAAWEPGVRFQQGCPRPIIMRLNQHRALGREGLPHGGHHLRCQAKPPESPTPPPRLLPGSQTHAPTPSPTWVP